ncbi:MAG: HprK-related kinase A [Betaproteobacteria bacterium]|nr:HprK-related kinase A [Betaproteobacteria bacterium]MCX7195952.1 HprK-related kinase A [Pseudomonadota bacterium]
MNVSALTSSELRFRLRETGICLQTGSFITHVQTSIPSVSESVGLLYADYPLAEQTDFADFHVSLTYPRNLRRWFKPQVLFLFDGYPPFKPLPLDQAFPMLEWGLNWCISNHVNHCLMIHAAVVEKGGYAVIMPAPPGSGKSTLCAALVNRGWRLLSDELALIRVSDGKLTPLPRPVSLKNESIDIIRRYEPSAIFSRKVADTIKGTVAHMKAPADSITRATEVVQGAWVIFPKYQAGAKACLEALPQSRAFMRVADNSFNYSLLGLNGFKTMANLIDASLCYDFTYSKLDDAIEIFGALKPQASSK